MNSYSVFYISGLFKGGNEASMGKYFQATESLENDWWPGKKFY